MEKYNPLAWLEDLNKSILSSTCKANGSALSLEEGYENFRTLLEECKERNGTIWWVGNGGSAAMCSHLSQDILNKLKIKSNVLSDHSLLTCMANDFGYEKIYSLPLEMYFEGKDLLIAISSSGNSQNIINSIELAKKKGGQVIAVSAFSNDNKMQKLDGVDLSFHLPTKLYGIAEVGHEALLHSAIESMFLTK